MSFGDYEYIIELSEPSLRCREVCAQHALRCSNITGHVVTAPLPPLPKHVKEPAAAQNGLGTLQHIVSVRKALMVHTCLSLGYSVVFSDMDVYWHKDVARILLQQAVRNSNDLVGSTHFTNPAMNSGLFYFVSNPSTITFTREWHELCAAHPRLTNDQGFLNANLGIHGFARASPSSTKLSWSLASNKSMPLYEADRVFGDVYNACEQYTSQNELLASIHLTNPPGGSQGKDTCMKELYAGFFPQMLACQGQGDTQTTTQTVQLRCFLARRYRRQRESVGVEEGRPNADTQALSRTQWDKTNQRNTLKKGL